MHRWAQHFPTAPHLYLYNDNGVSYYVSPRLGWYLSNWFWLHFAAMGLFFLITLIGGKWARVH